MTIASSTNKHIYQGNGATTQWPFTFKIFDESNIQVYLTDPNGAETKLDTGYRVDKQNGYVEYPYPSGDPLPAGWKITLLRVVPLVQETDFVNQGPFFAEVIEDALDRLTAIDQQQQEKLDRAIRLPVSAGADVSLELPTPVPLKSFRWDATGKKLEVTDDPKVSADAAATSAANAAASAISAAKSADLAHAIGVYLNWQPNKTYIVGDICYSPNAPSYTRMECTVAGTSGTIEPTWPAVGQTVTDGTATWVVRDICELQRKVANNCDLIGWELTNKVRKKQALVTFTSDDGKARDITKLQPIFDAEEVPLVLAIPPAIAEIPMSTLKDLQDNHGWEIASHTMNHVDLTTVTLDVAEQELQQAKDTLISNGIKCSNFCIPYGHYNDDVLKLIRKYYRSARTSLRGTNELPLSTFKLYSVVIAATVEAPYNTLDYYKSMVDKAVTNSGWVIFLMHGYNDTEMNATQLSYLQQVIQYTKSLNVPIVTMEEALNRIGNIIDTDDFVLGADGIPQFKENLASMTAIDAYTSTNVIQDFPINKITYTHLSRTGSTGFPEESGGLLITNRISTDSTFNFQDLFIPTTGNHYRRQAESKTTWRAWYYANAVTWVNPDTYNVNTPITDFPAKKITYCRIGSSNANGSPSGTAGLLMTNRIEANGWVYQEYHVYNSADVYKRTLKNDGTWTNWVKLNMEYIEVQAADAVNNNSPLSAFTSGKMSYCHICTANASGFPTNIGGTLVTNRLVGDQYFAYQEYHVFNTGDMYKRYWTGTAWSTWRQITMA